MNSQTNPLKEARTASMPRPIFIGTRQGLNVHEDFPNSVRKTARRLQITPKHLQRLENGEMIPRVRTAKRIALEFGFENADAVIRALKAWQKEHRPKQ